MMGQHQSVDEGRSREGRVSSTRSTIRPATEPVNESGAIRVEREPFRRSYIDRDGLAWEVREVAGYDVPGSRGSSCLVFESSVVIRRVWEVPANWWYLSSEELADLSWRK